MKPERIAEHRGGVVHDDSCWGGSSMCAYDCIYDNLDVLVDEIERLRALLEPALAQTHGMFYSHVVDGWLCFGCEWRSTHDTLADAIAEHDAHITARLNGTPGPARIQQGPSQRIIHEE